MVSGGMFAGKCWGAFRNSGVCVTGEVAGRPGAKKPLIGCAGSGFPATKFLNYEPTFESIAPSFWYQAPSTERICPVIHERRRSSALSNPRCRRNVIGEHNRGMASRLSIRSRNSLLSIGSENSVLSIGSEGSALSIGSVGSFASIGSVASAFSAFAAFSFLSRTSLFSARSANARFSWSTHNTLSQAERAAPDKKRAGIAAIVVAGVISILGWRILATSNKL